MKKLIKIAFINTLFLGLTISCSSSDNEPTPPHEHEEISKLQLVITSIENGGISKFDYAVTSGQTEKPTVDIPLKSGKYNVIIKFFSNDGHDQTDEVLILNAEEHFIYYQKFEGLAISYDEDDNKDSSGNKLGRKTTWEISNEADEKKLAIYLIHGVAEKNPEAVNSESLGGHVDIQAQFKLIIE